MITLIIIGLIIINVIVLIWYYTRDTQLIRIKKGQVVEFKQALELTGLPIITLYQGKNKYNFIFDTGSNVSYINKESGIVMDSIQGKDTWMGAEGTSNGCTIENTTLYLEKTKISGSFRVADMSGAIKGLKDAFGVTVAGLLGTDIFNKYSMCIDFKEKVIYTRK